MHHAVSFFPLDVHQRIRDEVEPIWVVNTEVDPPDGILRLLARLGPVVDVAGLDLDESAARLGAESPRESSPSWTTPLSSQRPWRNGWGSGTTRPTLRRQWWTKAGNALCSNVPASPVPASGNSQTRPTVPGWKG